MSLAHEYAKVFRIWPMDANKRPLAAGFGADNPRATWNPDDLDPALPVGILCGPPAAALVDCGYHVLGLDLDKTFTRVELEDALGPLPETLSSKGGRHLYYWIPSDHGLWQRNAAITCEGGQLDIRPCAGGYFVEKGDWDGGFDPSRIAELPAGALLRLREAIGERKASATAPPLHSPVQLSDKDGEIVDQLTDYWQPETTGDQAFGALGGWLARRGVSWERASAITRQLAAETRSSHPDPEGRVAQGFDGSCPLGRPALQAALSRDADEVEVLECLDRVEALLRASTDNFEQPEPPAPVTAIVHKPSPFIGWQGLMEPLGEVPWLVKDLELCPGRPPMFISDSGVGKTWTLQSLALSIATGQPVFGRFPCRKGPVLHLSRDSGLRATKARYQRLARGMGVHQADIVVYPQRLELIDKFGNFLPSGFEEVAREAERGKYALVILDSLAALCVGIDENSVEIGAPLRTTTDDSCVWLWSHHTTKNGEGYRGSGAIKAAAGAIWLGTRDGDHALWTPGKHSEEHEFGDMRPFRTSWVQDEDGGARIVCVADEPEEREDVTPQQKTKYDVLTYIHRHGGASYTDLCTAAGAPPGTTGRAKRRVVEVIGSLAQMGLIQNTHSQHYIPAPGTQAPRSAKQC